MATEDDSESAVTDEFIAGRTWLFYRSYAFRRNKYSIYGGKWNGSHSDCGSVMSAHL